MHLALHPEASREIEALAARGFEEERAIGSLFGLIDDLWLAPKRPGEAMPFFEALPYADAYIGRAQQMRSLDSQDGPVGFIVTMENGVLLILAASTVRGTDRREALGRALQRILDLSWVVPEEE